MELVGEATEALLLRGESTTVRVQALVLHEFNSNLRVPDIVSRLCENMSS